MPSHPDLASRLDPATLAAVVGTTLDALPVGPGASAGDIAARREAALLAIAALGPRDPLEAMLAARATVTHYAIMECFRRAVLPDVEDAMAIRLRNNAISLSRLFTATLRELEQLRARPPRPVPAAPEAEPEEPQPANLMTDLIEPALGPVPPLAAEAWLARRDDTAADEPVPSHHLHPGGAQGPPPRTGAEPAEAAYATP